MGYEPQSQFTVRIQSEDNGRLSLQTNSLVVGNANLDYEEASLMLVQVRCSNSGSPPLSLVKVLSITVDDVNEAPTGISLSSDAIAENQSPILIGRTSLGFKIIRVSKSLRP